MSKIQIGVDIDDTLAQFMTGLVNFYNNRFKTNLHRDDFKEFALEKTWSGSREQAIEIVFDFYQSAEFRKILPMIGSVAAIRMLKRNQRYNFSVITSRPTELTKETTFWLNTYFPDMFEQIILTNSYSKDGSPSKTKRKVCDELGIKIYIDDCLESAIECVEKNRKVLLLNSPWNENKYLPKEIIRVSSWAEIVLKISRST